MEITKKASEALKSQLVSSYAELGGWDKIEMGWNARKAAEGKLVETCAQSGIGFRIEMKPFNDSNKVFNISLGVKEESDEVIKSYGIRLFCNSVVYSKIKNYRLDYKYEPEEHFAFQLIGK